MAYFIQNLGIMSMGPKVCEKHQLPIILVCLSGKCQSRTLCLLCADSHRRHDLVSLGNFTDNILRKLQVNSANPDKPIILKELNHAKDQMLYKIAQVRNKINAALGECEDLIERYFSQLFFSLAEQSHEDLLCRLDKHFSTATIDSFIDGINMLDKLTLGTADGTKIMIYAHMEQYRQKINEISVSSLQAITAMKKYLSQMTLAKPREFKRFFDRQRNMKAFIQLCDGSFTAQRRANGGGKILSLTASPFSPIDSRISFRLDRVNPENKSIVIGACLQEVVKGLNYINCNGLGKGVYAIDQNCPYMSNGEKMLSSWNHHDTQFSQSHVGSTNLVGFFIQEGDTVTLSLDYYNSVLTFIKGFDEDSDENEVYEMPIKLDQGPIYPYVSLNSIGDRISIVQEIPQPVEEE